MRRKATLITGAAGEIGQALVESLVNISDQQLITLDIQPSPAVVAGRAIHIQGDILDGIQQHLAGHLGSRDG